MTTYHYENEQDGYCEYATKPAAVRNAEQSRWHSHEKAVVFAQPSGKIVHEVANPRGVPAGHFD